MTHQALAIVPEAVQLTPPQGVSGGIDVVAIQAHVASIAQVIDSMMVPDIHYGQAFPGSDKDSLLQPGAELMFLTFDMAPNPEPAEERLEGGHLRIVCNGEATAASGRGMGRLSAECSTMEPKYRFHSGGLACPECNATEIRKSKRRATDRKDAIMGYYCWKKAGVAMGCGATFEHDDERITGQNAGKVEREHPEELWHTVRRMAEKRWLVALARRMFALSGRFVDQEAAQNAAFDVDLLGPILRALPGERTAKWADVVAFTLERFAKAPRDLTCLEGSVVLQWLGGRVESGTAKLSAADFGESPEAENGRAPEPKAPQEKKAPEPEPKAPPAVLAPAQYQSALAAIRERDGVTYAKVRKAKGWNFTKLGEVPAELFEDLMEAVTAGDELDDGPALASADDLAAIDKALDEVASSWPEFREAYTKGEQPLPDPSMLTAAQVPEVVEAIIESQRAAK